MKRKKLEKMLRQYGWWLYEEGRRHSKWTNGLDKTTIPRHSEVKDFTAKDIIDLVQRKPGKKYED